LGEKRRNKRYGRRLRILYGEKDVATSAFTRDVSKGGAFVVALKMPPVGTRLHVQLHADLDWASFEAEVRWHKVVPPAMRQVEQGGFGVRFFRPEELVDRLVPQLRTERRFELFYPTVQDFQKSYQQELKHGGAFVRTELALQRDAEVTLDVRLEFAQRSLELVGKVLQTVAANPQTGSAAGVAVTFKEKEQALKLLAPFLG
jgi:Tfp pilus assembly protein PilZ